MAIKDIEPGYVKSRLSILSDRFITGDKNIQLISAQEAERKILSAIPSLKSKETNLFEKNKPNYCLLFQ